MLHKDTVESETLALLGTLSRDEKLADFFLVGGTALSLQLGHRKSIDLDLFTRKSFDPDHLTNHLRTRYPDWTIDIQENFPNTLMVLLNNIKVDFVQHNYPLLHPLELHDPIRMASLDDIAAMKVNAIVQSGKRMKDFVDMAEIAKYRSIQSVVQFYMDKYPNVSPVAARMAISYFEDVTKTDPPRMLKQPLDWERTKNTLTQFAAGRNINQSPSR
ncbi:MAG: nucleotidyl transferase AbiEii/AbiGii toxin family protein [Tunicatimonas sp.]